MLLVCSPTSTAAVAGAKLVRMATIIRVNRWNQPRLKNKNFPLIFHRVLYVPRTLHVTVLSITKAFHIAASWHNTAVFQHFRQYVCHEGGALSPGGARFVPLDVWKWRQGQLVDWPQAALSLTRAGLPLMGGGRLLRSLSVVRGGSRAHSANTEGQWGAPGNVPHRGHRTMLWWNSLGSATSGLRSAGEQILHDFPFVLRLNLSLMCLGLGFYIYIYHVILNRIHWSNRWNSFVWCMG